MITFDAHCDTATEALDRNENIFRNSCQADLERMGKLDSHVQVFAAFIDPEKYKGGELLRLIRVLDFFQRQAEEFNDYIRVCRNYDEIDAALSAGKTAALMSVENGGALQGDLSTLRMFYRLGVRSLGLTWNFTNEIADGVKDSANGTGLTAFGREVVSEMNSLGMLVDVSHLSEKSFWDVLEVAKAPLTASHSNALALCPHPRNLSDSQIKAIKANSGVIGINLYPYFLTNTDKALIDDVVKHIEHIASLIGEDNIGLGADLDGVECLPGGMKGIQDLSLIFERLYALNYSQTFIEKIAGGNFMDLVKRVLR